ncbi:MAG TPA: sugar ABC transporter substrate-binding protein [Spirochaetia bacterium]
MRKGVLLFVTLVALLAMVAGPVFASGGSEKAKKDLTIGVVIPYEIGWFSAFHKGVEVVAKAEGVKIVWAYNNYKADEETKAVQNLISMGVDGINLTAVTPESAEYSCRLANDAKIPIQITESGKAEGKGKPIAIIDFDWNGIYRYIADNLRKDVQGPMSIINIQGMAGSAPVNAGIQGFKDEMAKLGNMKLATEIEYGNYAAAPSLALMQNYIQAGLKFNVAVGSCQEITDGIIQGLKQANLRDKVTVVSVNGGEMDVDNIQKGNIDYILSQSPGLHGMICAANLIAYLKGGTYQKSTYSPVIWVNKDTYKTELIPWAMDDSWLPVVKEFLKSGKVDLSLRKA